MAPDRTSLTLIIPHFYEKSKKWYNRGYECCGIQEAILFLGGTVFSVFCKYCTEAVETANYSGNGVGGEDYDDENARTRNWR